jgi:hypothetical protein
MGALIENNKPVTKEIIMKRIFNKFQAFETNCVKATQNFVLKYRSERPSKLLKRPLQ